MFFFSKNRLRIIKLFQNIFFLKKFKNLKIMNLSITEYDNYAILKNNINFRDSTQ